MKDDLLKAMAYCRSLGADYADLRFKDILTEQITLEDGKVMDISNDRSRGFGIRVYVDGAMGFAAANDVGRLHETAERAYQTALASRTLLLEKVTLSPKAPVQDTYATPITIDPFTVPLADKLALLTACDGLMRKVDGVAKTVGEMHFRREDVVFADTEDSYITQTFYQSSGSITATAVSESDMQSRGYFNYQRGGYETVLDLQLAENAERVAREAVALINAPDCPTGTYDLILTPKQMMLQIHESVGHPTELDRVFGSEAAYAGMSFVTTDYLTTPLQYGSEQVTIVADATTPLGLGTFGYDDEGVPAQRVVLVDKGMFKHYQTSRDNAPKIGQTSHGMGLADGWQIFPSCA